MLLELLNDVFTAGDDRLFTVVISLDISAAFDTIIHTVLHHRLQTDFGMFSVVLDWVRSYLSDRQQYVKIGQHSTALFHCRSGLRCTARQRPKPAPIRCLRVAGWQCDREFRRALQAVRRR